MAALDIFNAVNNPNKWGNYRRRTRFPTGAHTNQLLQVGDYCKKNLASVCAGLILHALFFRKREY